MAKFVIDLSRQGNRVNGQVAGDVPIRSVELSHETAHECIPLKVPGDSRQVLINHPFKMDGLDAQERFRLRIEYRSSSDDDGPPVYDASGVFNEHGAFVLENHDGPTGDHIQCRSEFRPPTQSPPTCQG